MGGTLPAPIVGCPDGQAPEPVILALPASTDYSKRLQLTRRGKWAQRTASRQTFAYRPKRGSEPAPWQRAYGAGAARLDEDAAEAHLRAAGRGIGACRFTCSGGEGIAARWGGGSRGDRFEGTPTPRSERG